MRKPGAKAIVEYQGKIVLVLRDDNPAIPYPNVWNTPDGGIEDNETPREAMLRELQEEIGLITDVAIDLGTTTYSDGSIVYRFFCPVTSEQFSQIHLASEGQRLDWFSYEEALALEKSPHLSVYLDAFTQDFHRFIEGADLEPRHEVLLVE